MRSMSFPAFSGSLLISQKPFSIPGSSLRAYGMVTVR